MTLKSMWCKGSSTADPHPLLLLRHSFSFRVSSAVESQRSQRSGFQSTLHHILVLTGDDLCLSCLVFNFFDDLSEQEFRNSLEIGSLGQVLETDSEKTRQAVPSVKLLLHQLKSLYQSNVNLTWMHAARGISTYADTWSGSICITSVSFYRGNQ